MLAREKLIQEIAQAPDILVEEVLDFLLFAKARRSKPVISENLQEARPFGLCTGEFTVPDNFNDPLPEEILSDFEGKF
ncbi:DUF2281 domain-containing protein [Scytonema sp. NUACC26]|uniref:DUF2281 domain-containing protein n=1 Tax=Scytonema sp. NUACC26 TaxID=3140176 RepID=UPI0034DBB695